MKTSFSVLLFVIIFTACKSVRVTNEELPVRVNNQPIVKVENNVPVTVSNTNLPVTVQNAELPVRIVNPTIIPASSQKTNVAFYSAGSILMIRPDKTTILEYINTPSLNATIASLQEKVSGQWRERYQYMFYQSNGMVKITVQAGQSLTISCPNSGSIIANGYTIE